MKHPILLLTVAAFAMTPAHAVELEALIDLRLVSADSRHGWLYEGLDKQRFDARHEGLRLGQAVVEARAQPFDTVGATLVLNAYSDRDGVADVTEAYLTWRPLPRGPWRWELRAGAFFPEISLENSATGWTSPYMLSTSAINNWVGEEMRTIGAELSLARPGRFANSPHDLRFAAAAYGWNDAAGGLITWRGWTVGDRITGLSERVPLADLPVFRPGAAFAAQVQWEEPFHEIDDRVGWYVDAAYGYRNTFELRALHYDNRGDPFGFSGGQWAWETVFDAFGLAWRPLEGFELLAQYLRGDTVFGVRQYGVFGDFRAWYGLASYRRGAHRVSLRYDDFAVDDRDFLAVDDNAEDGRAWAVAYLLQLTDRIEVAAEYLRIASRRPARMALGAAQGIRSDEDLYQFALRWRLD